MPQPRNLRVFLASPSDVEDERNLARKVLDRLRYDPFLLGKVALEIVAWDNEGAGTPMLATLTPQEAIAQNLPKPSDCDLVVVIFWSRMGTPLPEDWVKPQALRYLAGTEWASLDARYLSGTEWEYFDALQAAENQNRPRILVYRRTQKQTFDPDEPKYEENGKQWRLVKAFFDAFRNPGGSSRRGYNQYATPAEFERNLEHHLKSQIKALLNSPPVRVAPPSPTPPGPQSLREGSPFLGLRAFTPNDASIFFGRGRETDNLIGRLRDSTTRFLAVIGASGSGKSSLVAAGLIPRLQSGAVEGSRDWSWFRFTPGESGENPFMAVAAAFKPVLETRGKRFADVAKDLLEDPQALGNLVDLALAGRPDWAKLLLFVDQFEELFTLAGADYRAPFIDWLGRAATQVRVRILVTLRADFYHLCLAWDRLTGLLENGSYPLKAPGAGALHEMITRPAERAGLSFEANLANHILDETSTEPGALALMAFALSELYAARKADGLLTWAAYKGFNGVPGAIAKRAEDTIDKLDDATQAALGPVFRELVDVDEQGVATRRRSPMKEVCESEPAARLVGALTDARLLVVSQTEDLEAQAVVEVAHETLLRSWQRLATWIEETSDDLRLRRQITQLAGYWEQHEHRDEHRWPDERVVEAVGMLEHLGLKADDLPALERDFLGPLECEPLLVELNDPAASHKRRAFIGERLDALGDTRDGVGVDADGTPDIVWCTVRGGNISIEVAWRLFRGLLRGRKKKLKHLGDFQISRYPVTVRQYCAFLEADDGWCNKAWWQEGRGGHLYRDQQGPLNRDSGGKNYNFGRFGNHPAVYVSWFDAVAFCRWLSERSKATVRLPDEWEWQWAAMDGESTNVFPWGSDWEPKLKPFLANTFESRLGAPTAVGMYPAGATPTEVFDMAGTVWEWCLNKHTDYITSGTAKSNRVLRGGSWYPHGGTPRSANRRWFYPELRFDYVGFRLLCPSE